MTAIARGNQLLDGGIDGGIFATDAAAREEAKQEEGEAVPREPGQRRCNEVDDDGDEEEFFAPEPIGQPAEKQRADDRAEEIGAASQPNLGIREMKRRAVLQCRRDRTGERHFEPVENPGDPERGNHQDVKAAPGQTLEPRRNQGRDLFRLMRGCRRHTPPLRFVRFVDNVKRDRGGKVARRSRHAKCRSGGLSKARAPTDPGRPQSGQIPDARRLEPGGGWGSPQWASIAAPAAAPALIGATTARRPAMSLASTAAKAGERAKPSSTTRSPGASRRRSICAVINAE